MSDTPRSGEDDVEALREYINPTWEAEAYAALDRIESELLQLREAVEWYADRYDKGTRARAALSIPREPT
jgi:hypothetical protein